MNQKGSNMPDETSPIRPDEQPPSFADFAAPPEAPTPSPAPEPSPAPAVAPAPAATPPGPAYIPIYQPTPPPTAAFAPVPSPAAAPQPGPVHHDAAGGTIALAVVAALVMGAIAGVAGGFLGGRLSSGGLRTGPQTVTVIPSTTDEPVVAAAAAAVPSIVNIDISGSDVTAGQGGLPNSHPTVPLRASGSGVAFKQVSGGGTYIVTNNHVVDNATKITVSDTAGKSYPGTVVGRDADSDVAVVRISEDLPIIGLGDSSKLLVGQTVVAIGSPFGFEHSVTSGVVSALGRSLSNVGEGSTAGYPLVDVIQTDAAINPGNSGGALVDRGGKLVGINTAIYSGSSTIGEASNAGIGFAIPVNTVARVADELIAGGKVAHPLIGLTGSTVDAEVASTKKLPVQEGALVQSLTAGFGAQKAGVKVGDIVTAIDGSVVRTMDDLILGVRKHTVGSTAKLTIRRGSQTLTLDVTVGDKPEGLSAPSESSTTTTPSK